MCVETMEAVTKLLTMRKGKPDNISARHDQQQGNRRSLCFYFRGEEEMFLNFNILPVVPSNIYAWIHIRQNLFNYIQPGFSESSFVLLMPLVMIAVAIGHIIFVVVTHEKLSFHGMVIIDGFIATVLLIYIAYKASRLEEVQRRQIYLLANHQTAVDQLHDHLRRIHISKNHCDASRRVTATVENLRQTSKALRAIKETVRDTNLTLTVFPGVRISQVLTLKGAFGFLTIVSSLGGFLYPYFSQ